MLGCFHTCLGEFLPPEEPGVDQGGNHDDPDLGLPVEPGVGHELGYECTDDNAAWEPHVEAVHHLGHLYAFVRVGNHRITGSLGAAIAQADEQRRDKQTGVAARIDRHHNTDGMREESKLHDLLRANAVVDQTADDHGDREAQEPHGVYPTQLLRRKAHFRPQFSKDPGTDTE